MTFPDDPDDPTSDPVTEVFERIERTAHEAADRALDQVGLPPTQRLDDIVGETIERIERIERTIRLPRPREILDDVQRGTQWLERQLGPLGDQLDSVRDQIEGQRDPTGDRPAPRSEAEDEDGWGDVAWYAFVAFLAWLAGQEFTVELEIDRALWTFDEDDEGRLDVWNKSVFVPPGPFAARLGDPTMHGDPVAPGIGSPNVLIGGKPALRRCDGHVCTKVTPTPHVATGFVSTYDKVEINGFTALRVGDYVQEGIYGLNPIVGGCSSVTIGPTPPPLDCWSPLGEPGPRKDWLPFRWTSGEVGHFKGKVILGVDIEGPLARVDGTVTMARLWAEETTTHDVPLGDIDGDGREEAWRFTTTSKAERVLGVSDVRFEVHAATRRLDDVEITPKDPPPKPPEITTPAPEIVEIS